MNATFHVEWANNISAQFSMKTVHTILGRIWHFSNKTQQFEIFKGLPTIRD